MRNRSSIVEELIAGGEISCEMLRVFWVRLAARGAKSRDEGGMGKSDVDGWVRTMEEERGLFCTESSR